MDALPREYLNFIVLATPILSLTFNIIFVLSIIALLKKKSSAGGVAMPLDEQIATTMKEAEYHATELMKDAAERAKKIIEEAGIIKESLEERLDQSLEEMNRGLIEKLHEEEARILDEFKKLFQVLSDSYQTEGARISERFKDEGDTMVKTFIQSIHAEINSVREKIFSRIDSNLSLIEEDLEKYRDQQYQKLEQNIKMTAKESLIAYMKNALNYELHEELTFKAMDQYKSSFSQKNSDVSK